MTTQQTTYVRIEKCKPAQSEVLRILFDDIQSVLGLSVRHSYTRAGLEIIMAARDDNGNNICHSPWLGYYMTDARQIYLRPELRGRQLYSVALHELGHHWGLDHTKRGIMTAIQHTPPGGSLSLAYRRRCLRSINRALMNQNLRKLQ